MARKKKQADTSKNRKLDEFLRALNIDIEKRDKIMSFVEDLTFTRLKELSTGKSEEKKNKLRLKMPWMK